jgi:hypothetical protein
VTEKLESVRAQKPQSLGYQPSQSHGHPFGVAKVELRDAEREKTQIPKKVL